MRTVVDLVSMAEPAAGATWIQIMKTGQFTYQGKSIEITQDDLNKFAENFHKKVRGVDIAVDVSHNPDAGSVGWFKDLRVENGKLMAQIAWTDEGAELIKSGKYRYFSPEFMWEWKDPESGRTYKDVLFGGGLTNRPFLKNMQPIEFSDDVDGVVWFGDNESGVFDPDGDGDNDSTTDPDQNPDWVQDVLAGITRWPTDPKQQKKLTDVGATKEACDAAFKVRQAQLKTKTMTETEFNGFLVVLFAEGENVTNAHNSPPKGKPQDKGQYADPKNYKYPIDEKHIKAALSYFNQGGQQSAGGYSADQWASIGRKIAEAANKLIGPGHSFNDGKIETPANGGNVSMEDDQQLNPNDGVVDPHEPDDEDAGKFTETHRSNNGGGTMETVSMDEFNRMSARLAEVEAENRRVKFSEQVKGYISEGKVVPAQHDKMVSFMETLNDDQLAKFAEFVKEQPKVVEFREIGNGGAAPSATADPQVLLSERTAKIAKERNIPYGDAGRIAFKELTDEGVKIDLKGKPLS